MLFSDFLRQLCSHLRLVNYIVISCIYELMSSSGLVFFVNCTKYLFTRKNMFSIFPVVNFKGVRRSLLSSNQRKQKRKRSPDSVAGSASEVFNIFVVGCIHVVHAASSCILLFCEFAAECNFLIKPS